MQDRNVILTGFMGTGKTSVGRIVADRLSYSFVDTDAVIEERYGPVRQIFERRGEDVFRRLEREVAYELAQGRRQVIATGGRMLLDFGNAYHLSRTGRIFCLTASPEEIVTRLSAGDIEARPLLATADPADRIRTLLAERADGYAKFEQVATDHTTPEAVADALIRRCRER